MVLAAFVGQRLYDKLQSKVHFNHRHIKSSYLTRVADIKGRYRSAFSTRSTTTVLMPTANIRTNNFNKNSKRQGWANYLIRWVDLRGWTRSGRMNKSKVATIKAPYYSTLYWNDSKKRSTANLWLPFFKFSGPDYNGPHMAPRPQFARTCSEAYIYFFPTDFHTVTALGLASCIRGHSPVRKPRGSWRPPPSET